MSDPPLISDSQRLRLSRSLLAVFCLLTGALVCAAADPETGTTEPGDPSSADASSKESAENRFRRVYVPAERPDAWPVEDDRYLPIERTELANLLRQQATTTARVTAITLEGEINNAGDLVGQGELQVTTAGSSTAFVPWPNRSLRISRARWQGPNPQPALLGLWMPGPGGDGRYGLAVPNSGRVAFDFEARGAADDLARFSIPLPSSIDRRLLLTLPQGVEPVSATALVERIDSQPKESKPKQSVSWLIRPPAGQDLTFSVPAGTTATGSVMGSTGQSSPVSLSTMSEVKLTREGAEIQTTLRLRSPSPLPRTLLIETPAALALMGAEVDGSPVTWRHPTNGGEKNSIEIPLTVRKEPHQVEIVLSAWSQTPERGDWQAPLFQTPGAVWEEGAMRVRVDPELSVVDLHHMEDAILAPVQSIPTTNEREYLFQFLKPTPTIELALAPVVERLTLLIDQSSELSDTEILSQFTLTVTKNLTANSQTLRAVVGPEWLIESVESEPAGLVRDWFLVEPGNNEPLKKARQARHWGRQQLVLQIASRSPARLSEDKLSASSTVGEDGEASPLPSVRIACRRLMPSGGAVAISALAPLQIVGAEVNENKLHVNATRPYELKLRGANRNVSDDVSATRTAEGWTLNLTRGVAGGWGISDGAISDGGRDNEATGMWGRGATVELTQQPLQFDGDIETSLQPTRQGWKYRTQLRIESPSSRVEPILCYFQPPLSGDSSPLPKWIDGTTGAPLDAVRLSHKNPSTGDLSPANQSATNPLEIQNEGEWWSVRPPSGAGSKATLIVETLLEESAELQIPLVSFPKAQRQTGRIALGGLAGSATHVRHEGLTAQQAVLPGELTYSYSPDDFRTPRPNPQLSIEATAKEPIISGRATPLRLASLESVWTPNGSTLHTASYEAVTGLDQFQFTLPKEINLIGVSNTEGLPLRITETLSNTDQPLIEYRVDALASPATSQAEGEALSDSAPAPPGDNQSVPPRNGWRRGRRILITYRTPAVRSLPEATPLLPQCEATHDSWEWRLLAPQGWRPATGSYASRDWRQRLFGILAQPAGHQAFNPFRSSDWGSVTQRATQIVAEPRNTAGAAFNRLRNRSAAGLAANPAQIPSLGGWEAYRFSGAFSPPPAVRFVQETRQQAWLLALQTVVMALAAWRLCADLGRRDSRGRGSWGRADILLLLLAMLVALIVPAAYSRVASAVWFGLVLAWPCRWLVSGLIRLSSSFQDSTSQARSVSGTSGPLVSSGKADASPILWLLALTGSLACIPARDCFADNPLQRSIDPSKESIQEVLIPVDKSGEEIGDKHYVRESFLSRLLTQQRKQHRPGPTEVLVEEVRHSGELLSDRPDAPVQAGRWTTTLRLRSLRRGAVVWLPLQQGAAVWPKTVSVDGVPAVLTWDDPAEASFVIPEPGPCVVSFSFEPVIVVSDGESCVQLPRLIAPASLLSVRYPPSLQDIRIPFAESVNAAQPVELRAILGKNPQLLVCWTETAPSETGDAQPVDLLQRIQVLPSGVRMQVQVAGYSKDQPLQIVTPVGWRLADEAVVESAAESVTAPEPANGDHRTGSASYVANRMSPLGVLQVPAVKVTGANVRRRLAAVVVDDLLQCQAVDPSQGLPIEAADFASQWSTNSQLIREDANSHAGESGDSDASTTEPTNSKALPAKTLGIEKVALAVDLNEDADWRLQVTPASRSAAAAPRLEIALGAKQTRYRLRLTDLTSYGPMIAVALPKGFNVDRVSTGPRDESRDVHWSHPQSTRLVIFKPADLPPGSWLEVTAHGPRAGKTLPRVALVEGGPSTAMMDVRVYREEGVLPKIEAAADNTTAEPLTPPKSWRVRPLASLRMDPSLPAPGLQIVENRPRFKATSLSSYSRLKRTTNFAWSAELQVKEGVLGELSLVAPSSLNSQDLQVLGPVGATLLKDSLGGPTWTLRLATPAAIGDMLRIDLRVQADSASQPSLKDSESGSNPAPLLELPQAIATQDFVAVPAPSAEQVEPPVRWSVRDMKRIHAPQGATALLPTPGKWRVFEVDTRSHGEDGEIARVFWTSEKQSPGRLRVTLADYQLQAHRQVESVLAARFLVEPRGATHCRIQLSEGDRLQALTIDGAPTSCVQESPGLWDMELRESLAPQMVEAIVVGATPASLVAPPQIVSEEGRSVPAQVSIWAVHAEDSLSVIPPLGGRIATQGVTKVVRLRALTQAALEQVAPSPEWIRAWRGRVEDALHDVEASYNADETSATTAENDGELGGNDRESQNAPITLIREARQWLASVGQQKGPANKALVSPAAPSESPGVGSETRSVELEGLEAASVGNDGEWTYLIQTPANNSASTPQGPRVTTNLTAVSKLQLLLVLATILAIVTLYRTPDGVDFPALAYEYRHALVAIGGVAWWLFLTPSVVGFLLLVAAAVGQLSLLWKQAQPAPP